MLYSLVLVLLGPHHIASLERGEARHTSMSVVGRHIDVNEYGRLLPSVHVQAHVTS